MKYEIKIKKGDELITLPRDRVMELLSECGEAELRALIAIAALGDSDRATEASGLDDSEFSSALAFWRGARLVGRATQKKKDPENIRENKTDDITSESSKIASVDIEDIPEYTSADIKRLKGKDALFDSIMVEAQQTFGKVFNNVEHNYIVAMRDHLSLDGEYILMLLEYFRREAKPLCYVVRVADNLVKQGITDPESLEQYLKRRDSFKGNEGKYRDLFGIGGRALTAYEEKYFTAWSEEMQMPFDLVRVAFERTIEKKGTPQKSYINGILKKWHDASVNSIEALERYEDAARDSNPVRVEGTNSARGATGESTFDVDDFFNAALKRMYGDSSTESGSDK